VDLLYQTVAGRRVRVVPPPVRGGR